MIGAGVGTPRLGQYEFFSKELKNWNQTVNISFFFLVAETENIQTHNWLVATFPNFIRVAKRQKKEADREVEQKDRIYF